MTYWLFFFTLLIVLYYFHHYMDILRIFSHAITQLCPLGQFQVPLKLFCFQYGNTSQVWGTGILVYNPEMASVTQTLIAGLVLIRNCESLTQHWKACESQTFLYHLIAFS